MADSFSGRLIHKNDKKTEMADKKFCSLSDNCIQHEDETVTHYCKIHDVLCCNLCLFQDHQYCTEICTVAEKAAELKDSVFYKELIMELTKTEERIEKQIKTVTSNMEISEKSFKEAIQDIDTFQKEFNEKINSLRNQMIKESEDLQDRTRTKITELEVAANKAKMNLEDLQEDWQTIDEEKLHSLRFIAINNVCKQQKELEDRVMRIESEEEIKKYCFVPNEMLISLMQNVDALGELFVQDVENANEPSNNFYKNYLEHGVRKWFPVTDSMMVLDHIQNCIHLIEGDDVRLKKLTSGPWDMTFIESNSFVVTLPTEKKLQFLHISDNFFDEERLIEDQCIEIDFRCEGIVYAENDIFVACSKPANVTRIELNGNVKQIISPDELGVALFKQPAYIAFHQKTDTLYVSDRETGSIIAMTRDGEVKQKFENVMKVPIAFIPDEDDVCITGLLDNGRNRKLGILRLDISNGEAESDPPDDYREFMQLSARPLRTVLLL